MTPKSQNLKGRPPFVPVAILRFTRLKDKKVRFSYPRNEKQVTSALAKNGGKGWTCSIYYVVTYLKPVKVSWVE